jgi:hypothetical protein
MPRGSPKQTITLRIGRELRDAVAVHGVPFTKAVEEGLALWLTRAKREAAKVDKLAKQTAPPMPTKTALHTEDAT